MTDRPIRASDQERESVVEVMRDAIIEGRLTFDEFEERTAAVSGAKTCTELRVPTPTCPSAAAWGRPPPAAAGRPAGRTARAPAGPDQAQPSVRPGTAGAARLDRDLGRGRLAGHRRRTLVRVHLRPGYPHRIRGKLIGAGDG